MPRRANGPAGDTKLAQFMRAEGIAIPYLSDVSHVSKRYIGVLCAGDSEPTRAVMVRIARAVSYTVGRLVEVAELFDLELHLDSWLLS